MEVIQNPLSLFSKGGKEGYNIGVFETIFTVLKQNVFLRTTLPNPRMFHLNKVKA
jgi:hypothetical protein